MRVVQLGARVDPDVKAGIEEAAKAESRTAAALVNLILRDWLKTHGIKARGQPLQKQERATVREL